MRLNALMLCLLFAATAATGCSEKKEEYDQKEDMKKLMESHKKSQDKLKEIYGEKDK
jgi:hypothetical protein